MHKIYIVIQTENIKEPYKKNYEVLLFHRQYLWWIVILNVVLVWKYINII